MKHPKSWPLFIWLLCLAYCASTTALSARLKPHDPVHMGKTLDGELNVSVFVTNIGYIPAYNGEIHTTVNDGESVFSCYLGFFMVGETKPFKQILHGYKRDDDVSLQFKTT